MATSLEQLIKVVDDTLTSWEPDDAVAHFGEMLRTRLLAAAERGMEARDERLRQHVAKALATQSADANSELDAMRKALILLHPLPFESRRRALKWIGDRLDNFGDPERGFPDDEPPF